MAEKNREIQREEKKNDAVLLLNKGKRGLGRLIFGRTALVLALLAVQTGLLFWGFIRLGEYLVYGGSLLLSLAVVLVLVNKPGSPAIKITWIILIMLAPVFALPLYLFVDLELGHRLARNRLAGIQRQTAPLLPPPDESLRREAPHLAGLGEYVSRSGGYTFCRDSGAAYLPSGEAFFAEALARLEEAERFIFLEYFIVEEGYMWGRILNVLERKARAGVEVRLLYDGTCAVGRLPYQYPQKLEALGIRCKMYAPLRPLVSTHYNNRDHRKILVVDGKYAFTGGINLADEYINRRSLHGHWKDTAVLLTGRAVRGFTLLFLQMWNVSEAQEMDYLPYLDASGPVEAEGWVLPYGDIPFDRERVGELVYMDILNRAVDYVHITTPYLIIGSELSAALTFAAKRGVDVKLILPGEPDKRTVFAVSRSYYRELLEGGVKIYEYAPGFIHAKTFASDGETAVVGSINLDYRSLYHHFECAALLYRCPAVGQVEADFQKTLAQCSPVTIEDCKRDRPLRRFTGWLLRPLAPLL